VNNVPTGNAKGRGCLSAASPTSGCKIDAVSWYTSVTKPICVNERLIASRRFG